MTWANRVAFTPDGSLAYRPGEVIVRGADVAAAAQLLEQRGVWTPPPSTAVAKQSPSRPGSAAPGPVPTILDGAFAKFEDIADPLAAVATLRSGNIYAQVNHVLFATSFEANPFYANPFYANPFYANPFYANPFYANPFYANPFYANPFYANPFYANPFYANPFYANPTPAARHPSFDAVFRATGERPSSARPAPAVPDTRPSNPPGSPRVAILDTGFAATHRPTFVPHFLSADSEEADGPDPDDYLDPVAGHGTFITGIVEQVTPGCTIEVRKVIEPYGDGDEETVATALHALATSEDPPDLVNLSFGNYTVDRMEVLAAAVANLHATGTAIVASAGNDGTWVPMYPAAFDEVIGVAALAPDGTKASFSNYGPWVSASTYGVNIVSSFFDGFLGGIADGHPATFGGWARWSGTSFAAPRVVALLAEHMRSYGVPAQEAVRKLIGEKVEDRDPMLGVRFL